MSLRIWLPLDGDLTQQGSNSATATLMGTGITWTAGKIGKAATFPNSCASCIHLPGLKLQILSWACWFKCTGEGSGSSQRLLSEGRDTGSVGTNIWLSKAGTTLYWTTHKVTGSAAVTLNKWYHVILTCDGTKVHLYLNGEEQGTGVTYSADTDYAQSNDKFVIGKMAYSYTSTSNYFPFNGQVNDVRIYDHCLSAEEVREIANGLILHYKLDGGIWGNQNILRNSSGHLGTVEDSWSGTITTGFMDNESILIVQKAEADSLGLVSTCAQGQQPNMVDNNIAPADWTTGDEYTVSGQYYIPSSESQEGSDPRIEIEWRCIDDGRTTYRTYTINISREIKDQWIKFEKTFQVPSATDRVMRFYLIRLPGSCITTIYFKRIKIEKGSVATLWCPANSEVEINRNVVEDSSGYQNHGRAYNNPVISANTPRYSASTYFNGSNAYIVCNSAAKRKDVMTVNLWVYKDTETQANGLISCSHSTIGGWEIAFNNNRIRYRLIIGTSRRIVLSCTASTELNDGWNMITGTYENRTAKLYINGDFIDEDNATTTYDDVIYYVTNNLLIGANGTSDSNVAPTSFFQGNISDVRIYCTALSDNEIKKLYNSSMIFDNLGGIHTYSFEDDQASNITLSKTGILSSPVILEENNINNSNIQIGKISYPFLWADNITVTSTNTGHIISQSNADRYTIIKNINEFRSYSGKTLRLSYDISVPGARKSTENNTTGSSAYYGVNLVGTYSGTSGSPSSPRYCTSQLSYSGENTRIVQTMTLPTLNNAFIYATLRIELRTSDQPASTNNNTWSISNIRVEVIDDNLSQPWINGIELIEK